MTVEQYLSQMLGDLMMNNAKLAAERDALKEQLAVQKPPDQKYTGTYTENAESPEK